MVTILIRNGMHCCDIALGYLRIRWGLDLRNWETMKS